MPSVLPGSYKLASFRAAVVWKQGFLCARLYFMAEHMRNSQNKSNKFYGTMISSSRADARITDIHLPDLSERYFTLRRSDFETDAVLNVASGFIPVLSEDKIMYVHQPVMALFGPDIESVELLSRQISIEYEDLEEENLLSIDEGESESLTIGTAQEVTEDMRKVTSTVRISPVSYTNDAKLRCECWQEGEKLHIEVPTQWPGLIRNNVARLLSVPASSIVVHQMPYQNRHDEYVIPPAILAATGALATLKAGLPVVLVSQAESATPEIVIQRETMCTSDGKPVNEECTVTAKLGAFSLDDREFIRQCMPGLIPNYQFSHFHATVTTMRSSRMPCLFSGSSGYADALFSTEYHANEIAASFETPPGQWRSYVSSFKRPFTDYIPSADISRLAQNSALIAEKSDFSRKWASYSTQSGDFSLLSFTRGIALASGLSIAGVSTSLAKKADSQARITLTEKGNVTLLTSFPPSDDFDNIVRKTVLHEMDEETERDVIILDNDGTSLDSGPDVLSRQFGQFPGQLALAAAKLNQEKAHAELPYSIVFSCDESLMPCEFEPRGLASIIIELSVDNMTFKPVVLEAWVCVSCGAFISSRMLKSTVRQTVMSTLCDCGASFSASQERPFRINIFTEEWNSGYITDVTQALRGLTKAAFVSALRQTLASIPASLPAMDADIEAAYSRRGKEA